MEVEIKIKLDDARALKSKVEALGGKKIAEGLLHDIYFDDGQGFYESGKTLRIRTNEIGDGKTLLTYKECPVDHNQHVLSRPEIESNIDNALNLQEIFKNLGFTPYLSKDKSFENYDFDGQVLEFHYLPFLGDFLEIEALEEILRQLLPKIGLTIEQGLNKGYNRLFDEFVRENKLPKTTQNTFVDFEAWQKTK